MSHERMPHEVQPAKTERELAKRALSRRSFVRLAVGSLTALPVVAGGVLVEVPAAHAEEAQASTPNVIKIISTRHDQTCVSVVDISRGRRSATVVAGAKVKLKSYATEKTVEGTTNDQGVVVLNIADLAESVPKKTNGEFTFRAYVEMTAPGYRTFRTGIALVNGGKGLELATEKIEPGVPYPSRVSFDDWDVLYTNNSWTSYKQNDYTHDMVVELEGVSTKPINIKLADNDGRVFTEGTVTPKNDHVTITLREKYLEAGKNHALPVGNSFLIQFSQDDVDYEFPIALVVLPFQGKPNEDPKVNDLVYKLAPLTGLNKLLEFNVPASTPVIGGAKITLLPDFQFPIMVTTDFLSGYYAIRLNLTSLITGKVATDPGAPEDQKDWRYASFFGMKTKNGQPDPNAWKTHPSKTLKEQFEKGWGDGMSLYGSLKEKRKEKERQERQKSLFSDLPQKKSSCVTSTPGFFDSNFTISFWLGFGAKWQNSANLWLVNGGYLAVNVTAGGSFTKYFLIYGFPVFVSIGLNIDVTGMLTALAFTSPELFSFSKWKWDSNSGTTGFTLTIAPTVSLTVGAGIKGFFSLAFVGSFTLTARLSWTFGTPTNANVPKPAEGKVFRFVLGYSLKVGITIQAFLATFEKFWEPVGDPRWIDTWRSNGSGVSAQGLAAQAAEELGNTNMLDALNDPDTVTTIVTEASLSKLVEFEGSYDDSFSEITSVMDGIANIGDSMTFGDGGIFGSYTYVISEITDESGDECRSFMVAHYNDDPLLELYEAATAEGAGSQQEGQLEAAGDASAASDADGLVATSVGVSEPLVESAPAGTSELTEVPMAVESGKQASAQAGMLGSVLTAMSSDELGLEEITTAPRSQSQAQDQPQVTTTTPEPNQQEIVAQQDAVPAKQDESTNGDAANKGATSNPDTYGNFVPTREYDSVMDLTAQAEGSFTGLGRDGGLKPSRDVKLAPDVVSDPHTKIVDIMDTPHMFRIAVVSVNGKPRTRVVCTQLDKSKPGLGSRTFDVPTQKKGPKVRREDLFDYDFDVYVEQVSDELTGIRGLGGGYIHVVILSGYREQGDKTSISSLATNLFICYGLFIYASTRQNHMVPSSFKFRLTDALIVSGRDLGLLVVTETDGPDYEYKYHMFSCPQIVPVTPNNRKIGSWNPVLILLLDRASNKQEDLLLTEDGFAGNGATIKVAVSHVRRWNNESLFWSVANMDKLQDGMGVITDMSIYGLYLSEMLPGTDGYHLVQLYGKDRTYSYALQARRRHDYDVSARRMVPIEYPSDGTHDFNMAQLVPWRAGSFLATVNTEPDAEHQEELGGPNSRASELFRVDIENINGSPKFVFKDAGLQGFGITTFCVSARGDTIYWPAMNDDAAVFDADDEGALHEADKHDSYYIIKASEFWSEGGFIDTADGKFCKPYVFAEVSHRMDSLSLPWRSQTDYVTTNFPSADDVNFISTEIVNAREGKANIWSTTVPCTRCLTVISATAENNVVLAGMDVAINVAVRNDGNEWIRSFDANICKKDGTVLLTQNVFFNADTLLSSQWNPPKADGTLENNEYDYWLAPGKCGLYRLNFPVPEDWSGETEIVVRIANLSLSGNANPLYAQSEDLTAMAEEAGPIEYNVILEDEPYDVLKVEEGGDYEVDIDELYPAPVTVKGAKTGAGSNSGSNTGSSAGGGSGSDGRTGLPRTADDSRGLGALGLAAAALGTGMIAYSKRRTEIEEENAEE